MSSAIAEAITLDGNYRPDLKGLRLHDCSLEDYPMKIRMEITDLI